MSYDGTIVKKPWGYEYLVYENEDVGLWLLRIEPDQNTSMHCHPKKNTGLIVMRGEAEISFLNDKFNLKSPSKMMIRRGLFHSTKAISSDGVYLFEIETPKIKHDLVRLEDNYGRENKPYEDANYEIGKNNNCLWLDDNSHKDGLKYFCGRLLKLIKASESDKILQCVKEDDLLMAFKGGLTNEKDDPIYQPGDVISGHIFKRLSQVFKLREDSLILMISK